MGKAHPGFKSVQSSIAKKEGVSEDRAGAILASASRKASPAAKKKNPRLNRVKGAAKAGKKKAAPKAAKKAKAKSSSYRPSAIGAAMGVQGSKDPSFGQTY